MMKAHSRLTALVCCTIRTIVPAEPPPPSPGLLLARAPLRTALRAPGRCTAAALRRSHVCAPHRSFPMADDAASGSTAVDMHALASRLRASAHDAAALVPLCSEVSAHPDQAAAALAAGVLPLVLQALHAHTQDKELASAACFALSSLRVDTDSADLAADAASITRAATLVLVAHGAQSPRCAVAAALVLDDWCHLVKGERHFAGAMAALATALQARPEEVTVQHMCLRALLAVARTEHGQQVSGEHAEDNARALDAAVSALERHAATSRDVAAVACGVICVVSEQLPESERAGMCTKAALAVVAVLGTYPDDARLFGSAGLALYTLVPAPPSPRELDPATVAAGRAAAEAGVFGVVAGALERAHAQGILGADLRLPVGACQALWSVAPHAATSQVAMQPDQAARATAAACDVLTWSLAECERRSVAHKRGEDEQQAMQLMLAVRAVLTLAASSAAHADIVRSKGLVAQLPQLAVVAPPLYRTYTKLFAPPSDPTSAVRQMHGILLGSCGFCGAAAGPASPALKKCGGCRSVAYCSTACQRHAWLERGHPAVCAAAAAAARAAASHAASATN